MVGVMLLKKNYIRISEKALIEEKWIFKMKQANGSTIKTARLVAKRFI